MGVLDYTSAKEELDLQELMALGQGSQGEKEQRPSNNKKYRFTYLSIESEGESDVYNIQIIYPNGGKRKFKVKTNKGSVQISKNDTEGKKALVVLLKEQGLIEQDSPNTEIELGTLIVQDGRLNIAPGKNYCCSDIHGVSDLYKNAVNYLKPNDTLWVLGDSQDRWSGGIKILQDIIANSKNRTGVKINYVFGNHDYMMLQWINAFEKLGITGDEVVEFCHARFESSKLFGECDSAMQRRNRGRASNEDLELLQKYEPLMQKYIAKTEAIEEKWIGTEYEGAIKDGLFNGAVLTMWCFYELPQEEQQEIRTFLENSPLIVTRQFGDEKVALVHSGPPINCKPKMGLNITYRDIMRNPNLSEIEKKKIIYSMVWERTSYFWKKTEPLEDRYNMWNSAGYKIIHGHTITKSKQVESRSDGTISIDVGASDRLEVALYCIEDNEAIYINKSGNKISRSKCKEISIAKRANGDPREGR